MRTSGPPLSHQSKALNLGWLAHLGTLQRWPAEGALRPRKGTALLPSPRTAARRRYAAWAEPAAHSSAPLARSGSSGLATTERLVSGQQEHGYGAGASQCIPANNAEHICAQVRPLSATGGSHQLGGFRALGRRSLRWTPEQRRQQPKTTDYRHSLPRHDPGHRAGGAAPKGPPQAAIAMMIRSALADRFPPHCLPDYLFTSNCNCTC